MSNIGKPIGEPRLIPEPRIEEIRRSAPERTVKETAWPLQTPGREVSPQRNPTKVPI